MSKGWSAFDGLPTASFLDDTSGGLGGTFSNANGSNGVIRIPGACPPRSPASVAGPEDRFLKPIAENKHPNTLYTSPRNSPQPSPHASPNRQNIVQNQSPHAVHIQQQRPIGPALGAFEPLNSPHQPPRQPIFLAQGDVGTNTSPVTPRQELVYPRNDFYGSPGRSIQPSPAASNSSPVNPSPSSIPPHMSNSPSLQNMHGMPGMHGPYIGNGDHIPVRFTPIPPNPSSPSPTQVQVHSAPASPFHPQNFQRRDLMVQQDEVSRTADLLGAVQLDPNGTQALQAQRLAIRPPGTNSPAHLGNFLGWQLPDMPPKGYKTVICKFWENNMCTKGASCTFAHGVDDLKRFAGVSGTGGCPSALKIDRYKTKLCLFHMQGRCCKGPHCPYAHGIDELRAPLPPGLLQALQAHYPNFVFGNGENGSAAAVTGDTTEYDTERSDQLLHSYFDEFQMNQMQNQGMGGLMGPGDYQQGYDCGPDAYGDACYADGGVDGRDTTAVPGPEYGYVGNGGGYGDDEDAHELDQAQQLAALRFFERQGQQQQIQAHMNSLQQQAQARMGMAQQALRQQNVMMMAGGGGMQQPGGPGGPGYPPMYWAHEQQAWAGGTER